MVTHAGPGDYGKKPRPALVVQSDRLAASDSVLLCLITGDPDTPQGLPRIAVMPTPENGLRDPSAIMVEKIISARRATCGQTIGRLEAETMSRVDAALTLALGLAD